MSDIEKKISSRSRASAEEVEVLRQELANLKAALSKIGSLAGLGNYLAEFDLPRWVPSKEDMGKKRG